MNMQQMQAMQQQMMLQAAARDATKPLLEIRAGVLHQLAPPRKTVNADPRRGKIVVRYDEEGLLRFQWILRPSDSIELNLMLTPSCATFTRVTECKDGRVYVMKMQGGGAKRFFWLQEPKEDKDEELIKKLLELINNPPPPPASPVEQMMANMDDEQRAQFLAQMGGGGGGDAPRRGAGGAAASGGTPARPRPAAATGGSGGGRADFAASLTNLAQQLIQRGAGAGGDDESEESSHRVVSLGDILDAERVIAQLDDSMIESLAQHLPAGQRTRADLIASLRSPQLQQTVQRMGQMLNSEHFGLVMASLALPITGDLGVNAFIDAIQRQADSERKTSGPSSSPAPASSTTSSATSGSSTGASSTTSTSSDSAAKKAEEPKKP